MKFLVYTAEPLNVNAPLDSFEIGADKEIARFVDTLNKMGVDRVLDNETVSLFVEGVNYNSDSNIVTAEIYKIANQGTPLHQIKKEGGEKTVEEILSKHEDAFTKGFMGIGKVNGDVHIIVQNKFGSYFRKSCVGMELSPQYSSDTIKAIQESETIGKTMIDFGDNYDVIASLLQPPKDEDLREDDGFGKTNLWNDLLAMTKMSRTHRITLDISRDEWLENVEVFEGLIKSGIVSTIKVVETKEKRVRLGEGGDRAIRKYIETTNSREKAVYQSFSNLENKME
ncbi:hypothetical protein [Natrialba taiwanensis]|uniref:Uncharacterized protein n=1 Tax=Natrialba taiwanensis DSM 12281 TaxID=1230458 RepID=L9ZSX7_9EURY|nr:hypothetical protein [Natrialba taiwanensis]ELY88293.1 hypothetical protein C484_15307 [Natrialba taiwanensis DSM 12281]